MSSSLERVFVIGASGVIGSQVIRHLINNGVKTTAYVRNESKAKDLFKEELATGLLNIAVGDYSTLDKYENAIKDHTRLFILLAGDFTKPAMLSQSKYVFGKIAFKHGVRQIIDLSAMPVRVFAKQGILGYIHASSEEKLWALAEKNPEQRSLVVLRPGFLMTNHFMGDIHSIKHANKIISCGPPSAMLAWIDPRGNK
jgi:NAD(P)-dependent dehydrogenase (short-subunit alcohol dehydrogenase family)